MRYCLRRDWTVVLLGLAEGLMGFGCSYQAVTTSAEQAPRTIFDRSEAELSRSTCKLTWRGPQTIPVPSVLLHTKDCKASLQQFRRVQNSEEFSNDELTFGTDRPWKSPHLVVPADVRRILSATQRFVDLSPNQSSSGALSFAVLREVEGAVERFECRVKDEARPAFYESLLSAIDPDNKPARAAILEQYQIVK